ncbi:hypothetical protein CC78DRAFT_587303 [Lojkania enalia]|uniref:Uncharacterized protein n=1 Tax=Lojkania enalia TaxID=147567 RepID=A0A9P4JZ03_9PLEO|nr:hypothetical protein CC78DRAFT_587303 [Didymosphaeria enalia]
MHGFIRQDLAIEWVEQDRLVDRHLYLDVETNSTVHPLRSPSNLTKRYCEYDNELFWKGREVNVYILDNGVNINHLWSNLCDELDYEPHGACACNFWRYYSPTTKPLTKTLLDIERLLQLCDPYCSSSTIVNVKTYNATFGDIATCEDRPTEPDSFCVLIVSGSIAIGNITEEHHEYKRANHPEKPKGQPYRDSTIRAEEAMKADGKLLTVLIGDPTARAPEQGVPIVNEPQPFPDEGNPSSDDDGYQAGTCIFHLVHRERCDKGNYEGFSATIERGCQRYDDRNCEGMGHKNG